MPSTTEVLGLSSVVDRVKLVLKPGDNFAMKFAEVE